MKQPRKNNKTLSRLLADFAFVDAHSDVEVQGISMDSRTLKAGDLFLAVRGDNSHGSVFIKDAVAAKVSAIVIDVDRDESVPADLSEQCQAKNIHLFATENLDQKAGIIASRFYAEPSAAMPVIGITGTNGKTSCTQFLAQCLHQDNKHCGVIGTLGNGLWGELRTSGFTTPMAVELQAVLASMCDDGADYVAMEVSSHGLQQGRVTGVHFDVAVLTNLSRDHLDYHGDMASYALAKKRLFTMPGLRYAVLNLDDEMGRKLAAELSGSSTQVIGYQLSTAGDDSFPVVSGELCEQDENGIRLFVRTPWGEGHVSCHLLGRFNAANVLAVLTVLLILDVPFDQALERLSQIKAPAGRMERIGGQPGMPVVIIDYAHTPDALGQVLQTLGEHCRGALWLVFGCGGDRDRGKRAAMGRMADAYADHIVLTNDNPRRENPEKIIQDILAGITAETPINVEADRALAIAFAIHRAADEDIVLIAGKGHEDYQIVGDRRLPFSDREVAEKILREAA